MKELVTGLSINPPPSHMIIPLWSLYLHPALSPSLPPSPPPSIPQFLNPSWLPLCFFLYLTLSFPPPLLPSSPLQVHGILPGSRSTTPPTPSSSPRAPSASSCGTWPRPPGSTPAAPCDAPGRCPSSSRAGCSPYNCVCRVRGCSSWACASTR